MKADYESKIALEKQLYKDNYTQLTETKQLAQILMDFLKQCKCKIVNSAMMQNFQNSLNKSDKYIQNMQKIISGREEIQDRKEQ